jgi:hypothetical protein
MYNVEIRVSDHEIDDLGRDQAIARATLSAWHHAIGNAHPKRSLILRSTEEWKGQVTDLPGLYIRFCFDVD